MLGRGARTRTLDTQFWRLVFYRLNYTPIHALYYNKFLPVCQDVLKKVLKILKNFRYKICRTV